MATKVKDATLSSVDFVRSGANQDAHIALFKSNGPTDEVALKESLWERFKNFMKSQDPETLRKDEEELQKSRIAKAKQTIKDENQLYTSVLKESMDSIVFNDELSSAEKYQMMRKSMDEFTETMDSAIAKWHSLDSSIEEIEKSLNSREEGEEEMKIDKSKLSPEEQATLEALMKKASVDPKIPEDDDDPKEPKEGEEEVEKTDEKVAKAFQEEMNALRKNMEDLQKKNEMDEMKTIAKKYTLLGKSEDELAQTLYDMKKSSEATFKSYVSLLDENLSMVEKSGLFSEIGKSGNGGSFAGSSTEEKIEKAAQEIRKSNPDMNYYDSIEKAWEQNPELAAEYEKSYMEGR